MKKASVLRGLTDKNKIGLNKWLDRGPLGAGILEYLTVVNIFLQSTFNDMRDA